MERFPKHDAAVRSALADLGVHEQPLGSNKGQRVQVYQHTTWLAGTGWPWCVAFWLYHVLKAGLVTPYRGAGAYAVLTWAEQQGWVVPASKAIPGDAVVFELGAGHLGMLKQKVSGNTVLTVDGNVSDRVTLAERPLHQVRGFVHIPETPVIVPPSPRVPLYEVITSVNGHKRVVFNGKASTIGRKLPKFLQRNPQITIRRKRR